MNLDELIRYENENTSLDFKKIQYESQKKEDFLKDIISMANAQIEGKAYIIIGVKCFPNGIREFYSIDKENFIDDAEYQQIVRTNIEPELKFKYEPYLFEGKLLGIFTIEADDECRPYIMKKQFGSLLEGDTFIRRGSQQGKMNLRDFDKVYEVRHKRLREREIKKSHIHFLIQEFKNNKVVLFNIKSYISEGPNILELWDASDEVSNHFIFETWDVMISSGIISTLDFRDKDLCRYAIKTIRDAKREIKTTAANWKRMLKWDQFNMVRKQNNPQLIIPSIPPEVALVSLVNNCNQSIEISLEAIGNAIIVLEQIRDKL